MTETASVDRSGRYPAGGGDLEVAFRAAAPVDRRARAVDRRPPVTIGCRQQLDAELFVGIRILVGAAAIRGHVGHSVHDLRPPDDVAGWRNLHRLRPHAVRPALAGKDSIWLELPGCRPRLEEVAEEPAVPRE